MTRVRITGLEKDFKGLKKRILDAVDDSGFEKPLANEVRAKVRKDGIKPNLAQSTIDYRGRIQSKKGPGFQAGKSSLTLSGQLLGALFSVFRKNKAQFDFDVKDATHKPYTYKKKNGKTSKHGGKSKLSEIFNGLMKDRPITNVFDDLDFKRKIERRLVSAIKRFIK